MRPRILAFRVSFCVLSCQLLTVEVLCAQSSFRYNLSTNTSGSVGPDDSHVTVGSVRSVVECMVRCSLLGSCSVAAWQKKTRQCAWSSTPSPGSQLVRGVDVSFALKVADVNVQGSQLYFGCQHARITGVRQSGVVTVDPDGNGSFPVWCDFDASDGWLVIQRRIDDKIDFFRNWTDYQAGFGDLSGNMWLGLDRIRRLSTLGTMLSVYLESFSSERAYANYSRFSIGSESTNYILSVSGYQGNAGDSLNYVGSSNWNHSGMMFSTKDRDNDRSSRFCAQSATGAWWFNDCFMSNLNGIYYGGGVLKYGGVAWDTFKASEYSLKTSVMRILV